MTSADPANVKLALLIDGDNLRADFLPLIMREASAIGRIVVRRLYGHFSSMRMQSWQKLLQEYALVPVHIPPAAKGKNATDMKLAIEAMDILHERSVDGFCIASSDSDFTTLAGRIRENGLDVYGFGEEKATAPYVAAYDRFFYCDVLLNEDQELKEGRSKKTRKNARTPLPLADISAAIEDVTADDDGWAGLGVVGQVLTKRMPDFDPRNYGYRKLSDLIGDIEDIELRKTPPNDAISVRKV